MQILAVLPHSHRATYIWPVGVTILILLLVPQYGWGASEAKNCLPEPTTNMSIAYGYVLSGTNCVVTVADLDSFRFSASVNQTVRLVAVRTGGGYWSQVCVDVKDPDGISLGAPVCSTSVQIDKKLLKTGIYTILVTEAGNDDVVSYNLSLSQVFPFPGTAPVTAYGKILSDEINPPSDVDSFVFSGAIGGVIRLNVTRTGGGYWSQVCIEVFQPDATLLRPKLCGTAVQTPDITLTKTGKYLIVVSENGNDDVVTYNLGLQCLAGVCDVPPPPLPPCSLTDALSYNATTGVLTMNFSVGNKQYVGATWSAWLTYRTTMTRLFAVAQAITPGPGNPIRVTKTMANVPRVGKAGVLSTLTTLKDGIVCANWALVNTGAPLTISGADTMTEDVEDLTVEELTAEEPSAETEVPQEARQF